MGYLIEQTLIKKLTVVIPEADVQVMDSTPYTLLPGNGINVFIPIACTIQIAANQTTPYTGFTHLHLMNTQNPGVGNITATYAINASSANSLTTGNILYSMLCNFQASPNRFGGINANKPIDIFFDLPVTGNGDMIVNLLYFII
jgi:hypothetical protein